MVVDAIVEVANGTIGGVVVAGCKMGIEVETVVDENEYEVSILCVGSDGIFIVEIVVVAMLVETVSHAICGME